MTNMRDVGHTLNARDLKRIEREMDAELPASYEKFLLAYNGGRPRPDIIDIDSAEFKSTDVKVFFGIDREAESENILLTIEGLEGCKRNQILPIAGDSYGCIFGLVLTGEEYGQVYYFEMTGEEPIPHFVATDFNEFLSKLRAPRPDELAGDDESANNLPETDPNTTN